MKEAKAFNKTIGIIGCGWLGKAVAAHFIHRQYQVKATTRTTGKIEALRSLGVVPFVFELGGDSLDSSFYEGLRTLIISIPPKLKEIPGDTYLENLSRLSNDINAHLAVEAQVIFTSSTGVYPNSGGPYTELSSFIPSTQRAQTLYAAENLIKKLPHKISIVRLAGLVGPNRMPVHSLSGKTQVPGGYKAANLIDQQDAVRLIWALSQESNPVPLINGVFPQQINKSDFYSKSATALGIAPPKFLDAHKPLDRFIRSAVFLGFTYENPLI